MHVLGHAVAAQLTEGVGLADDADEEAIDENARDGRVVCRVGEPPDALQRELPVQGPVDAVRVDGELEDDGDEVRVPERREGEVSE